MNLLFRDITFTHAQAIEPLFAGMTAHFPTGWTGIVGANGTGKTTALRLAGGELEPQQGSITRPGPATFCPQRTDDPPGDFAAFLAALDADAAQLRGLLAIASDWEGRWETLSHGERKRAQIAVALWQRPAVLLIDEPTNHIDRKARQLLLRALQTFDGIGLLVSHDRELLDALCSQCLFLDPPATFMRPGNYTEASAQARREEESLQHERETAQRELQRLESEYVRRRSEAAQADKKRSKRKVGWRDNDARGKINRARITGKDGQAGRLQSQLDGRMQQAEERLDGLAMKKRYDLNFWLPDSRSPREWLFTLPPGSIPLGARRTLTFPELSMARDARVALTGPNGAGKSTLIRHLLAQLPLPEDRVVYLPQEIDLAQSGEIMAAVTRLPHKELGLVMTVVSCLGSRPERLLDSLEASPGEIRKVLLALGIIHSPHLIIMDEPTNHLDLPAIELLEGALAQCPCGLLLVSHDERFLAGLATNRWQISMLPDGSSGLQIACP